MTTNNKADPSFSSSEKTQSSTSSFLLSHHPACARFNHHVIRIKGYDVCLGCLFVYPALMVTLLLLFLISTKESISYWYLFIIGSILFLISVIRRVFWKGLHNRAVHILFRVMLGASFGSVSMAVILAPVSLIKFGLILIVAGAWTAYQIGGWLSLKSECKTCPGYLQFPNCGGINLGTRSRQIPQNIEEPRVNNSMP